MPRFKGSKRSESVGVLGGIFLFGIFVLLAALNIALRVAILIGGVVMIVIVLRWLGVGI